MSLERPLITVITVVFNGEKHLEQAIQSVINQNYNPIEYIVIDGGSTDGTPDIIRKYENRIAAWISEPDKGIFDAMNKGIGKASGEFIGMLNADDWYEPDILGKVKEKITGLEEIENRVIYCDHYWCDEELSPGNKVGRKAGMKYWKGMTISHQSMFVHRSVYEKLGLYHLEYRYASDYEFFLRMIKAGVVFEKIPGYGVNFRKGGTGDRYMNRSITEVSRIVRRYFGAFSKEYGLFLATNRLPSMLGNARRLLTKLIGKEKTDRLRKLWRQVNRRKP